MSNSKVASRAKIQTMTLTGLMMAISFVMSIPPFGTIPLPGAAVTIAFLPAIVTTLLRGFWPGLMVATAAGTFSMIRAFVAPLGLLGPFFQNPLVSVLPRAMIAVTVFLVFQALIKTKLPKAAAVGISAAIGSITNTIGALGLMWIIYATPLQEGVYASETIAHDTVWSFFRAILISNATIEVIAYTIITTILVMTLRTAKLSKY